MTLSLTKIFWPRFSISYKRYQPSFRNRRGKSTRTGFRSPPPIIELPKPGSINQAKYARTLIDKSKDLVISTGPAGTGKTMLPCIYGIHGISAGYIEKIVITRPAVTVDEDHGFLPGGIDQKLMPWLLPIYDYFEESGMKHIIGTKALEVCPLSHIRGRTFHNTWIIADEMQNSTCRQMKTLLTRVGENSKLILTGDLNQCDLSIGETNGLADFISKYDAFKLAGGDTSSIQHIRFDHSDVMRSDFVKKVLEIYGEE